MLIGVDCYDDILEAYEQYKVKGEGKDFQVFKSLKRVMDGYSDKYSDIEIRNSLILVLNLFLNYDTDYVSKRGKFADELSNSQKKKLNRILNSEFMDQ